MLQKTRSFASSLALLLLFGAIAPTAANAWPLGKFLHLYPVASQDQDARITIHLCNRSGLVQQIKVGGCVHTMLPNDSLMIKAPEGTEVFAASNGGKHRKGDILVAMTADRNYGVVTLN
jgi:hypothetical protein